MKSFLRKTAVLSLIAAIVGTQSIVSFSKTPRLTEEQRIVHVLNRLGFGPRPGDVERLKSIGIDEFSCESVFADGDEVCRPGDWVDGNRGDRSRCDVAPGLETRFGCAIK